MQKQNDIATFPELFDGMEQFFEEQIKELKRTSAVVVLAVALPSTPFVLQALMKLG